mgnify:CR=1 FL=1
MANAQNTAEEVLDNFVSQVLSPVVCNVIIPAVGMLITPISLVFLAISGIKILAAGGNPGKINTEKEKIMMIVAGLFIVYGLTAFMVGAVNFLASGSITGNIQGILNCLKK